jgi:hypothetical protein
MCSRVGSREGREYRLVRLGEVERGEFGGANPKEPRGGVGLGIHHTQGAVVIIQLDQSVGIAVGYRVPKGSDCDLDA